MKKLYIISIFTLVCFGVHAQTLISRSYDLSPSISYTVFEPQKDTIYYWGVQHIVDVKAGVTDSFYIRFRKKNELIETLKFILSLESEETGRAYRLESTMDKNIVTTGKIDGFLLSPSIKGITIYNKELALPTSTFYAFDVIATELKHLNIDAATLKEKKREARRKNDKLDDIFKY